MFGRRSRKNISTNGVGDSKYSHDVIIIGAGPNGLACGAYLAKSGYRAIVLEKSETIGGACLTSDFDGTPMSRCSHLVRSLHPKVINDLSLMKYGLRYAVRHVSTFALDEDGDNIELSKNDWHTAKSIARYSSVDADLFIKFRKLVHRYGCYLAQIESIFDKGSPSELLRQQLFDNLTVSDQREFLRLCFSSAAGFLDEQFDTDLLKGALAFDAVLGQNEAPTAPMTAMSILRNASHEVSGTQGGLAYPVGGMGAVTNAMANALLATGGKIRTDASVKRVVIEDGLTRGVELSDGTYISAPIIVSSAPAQATLLELAGEQYLETEDAANLSGCNNLGATSKLNFLLDGLPKITGLSSLQLKGRYLLSPTIEYLDRSANAMKYDGFPEKPAIEFIFPSVLSGKQEWDGPHTLSAIVQYTPYSIPGGWESNRSSFLQHCADALEQVMPDIKSHIVGGELLTPPDLEREFGLRGGSWNGGGRKCLRLEHIFQHEKCDDGRSPIRGLYLCGAYAGRGEGVSGLSGLIAATSVIDDMASMSTLDELANLSSHGDELVVPS